jgi:hypothetical protein
MTAPLGPLAGTIRWAVVPYVPAPPSRLYGGERQPPVVVEHVEPLIRAAARGGDADLTYLVPGKVRPVLLLAEPPAGHHRDVVALRLLRLSRLSARERERVRRGEDELLLPLDHAVVPLPEESAVMLGALVRVHVDAVAPGPPLATVDRETLRVLGDRVIRHLGLDASLLVERTLHRLAASRRSP